MAEVRQLPGPFWNQMATHFGRLEAEGLDPYGNWPFPHDRRAVESAGALHRSRTQGAHIHEAVRRRRTGAGRTGVAWFVVACVLIAGRVLLSRR